MSVSTVVTPHEFEKTAQTAWAEFLATYFDGAVHSFGTPAVNYTFPEIETFFRHQKIEQEILTPKLIVEIAPGDPDILHASTAGVKVNHRTNWKLYLVTASETLNWQEHDQIDGLLSLVLNGARQELANSGLRIQRVSQAYPIVDPKFQATQRNVWTTWQGEHGSAN